MRPHVFVFAASLSLVLQTATVGAQAPGSELLQSAPATLPVIAPNERTSFVFRDMPIIELFEMLSRQTRTNIMLSRGVSGNVTVNLYDMTVPQAIQAIAEARGYFVQRRDNGFLISDKREPAHRQVATVLDIRTIQVQYSNPKQIADIAARHSTPEGRVSLLEERRLLVVEDVPEVVERIERLVRAIDRQPAQILIEAKILEISLDDSEVFGIDWTQVFGSGNSSRIGTQGLTNRSSPGLFFRALNGNLDVYLTALSAKGRVRTLASPKLLTLENQEAVTNVGDKIGYRLTTTINNVSTESIQFLDTGVILRVLPSVDAAGRIALRIRPEVSTGSVSGGIPSKKTTEVTTQLVAESGQSVMIAGLIKSTESYRRVGIPVIGELPGVGRLFSSSEVLGTATETVVVLTPRIVNNEEVAAVMQQSTATVQDNERLLDIQKGRMRSAINALAPLD